MLKGVVTSPNHDGRGGVRQPLLAELVAADLRSKIARGELADGSLLPKQEELTEMFRVGRPAIREALRILESENLVTVQRGKVGGARVHVPKASAATQALRQVMAATQISLEDLATAIGSLEPLCAGLCAERADRHFGLVPLLQQNLDATAAALDDGEAFTKLSREFHELFVSQCGNETMILVIGTLEAIWSRHEQEWAFQANVTGHYPSREDRVRALKAHQRIVLAVDNGDSDDVVRLERDHLRHAQRFPLEGIGRTAVPASALSSGV